MANCDEVLMWTLGDVVVKLRTLKKLKAYQLAKKADVEKNTISRLENGGNASLETLTKVARALGTSADELRKMVPVDVSDLKEGRTTKDSGGQERTQVSDRSVQTGAVEVGDYGTSRGVPSDRDYTEAVQAFRTATETLDHSSAAFDRAILLLHQFAAGLAVPRQRPPDLDATGPDHRAGTRKRR